MKKTRVYEADDPRFMELMYQGEPIVIDGDAKDQDFYFNHMNEYDNRRKTNSHACLKYGFWCWKNAFEKPRDVSLYIRKKLRDAVHGL